MIKKLLVFPFLSVTMYQTRFKETFTYSTPINFHHDRISHRRCSVKIGVLKTSAKFIEKHLYQSLFFNKERLLSELINFYSPPEIMIPGEIKTN